MIYPFTLSFLLLNFYKITVFILYEPPDYSNTSVPKLW